MSLGRSNFGIKNLKISRGTEGFGDEGEGEGSLIPQGAKIDECYERINVGGNQRPPGGWENAVVSENAMVRTGDYLTIQCRAKVQGV